MATTTTTVPTTDTVTTRFAWIITVQYPTPRGFSTSTRMGVVDVTPGVSTRAGVLSKLIGDVKSEIGQPNAVIVFIYLEPNQL